MRFTLPVSPLVIAVTIAVLTNPTTAAPSLTIHGLRCEYLTNPLGIDMPHPRLSWILASPQRGQRQSAYQVLVATDEAKLHRNTGDLWDSGKVVSDRSIQVPYAGKPMQSRLRCYWKVRVWDGAGHVFAYSAPASWEMGLLQQSDWHGRWIGYPVTASGANDAKIVSLQNAFWIWYPEGDPLVSVPSEERYFRRRFDLPEGRAVKGARLRVASDNRAVIHVNGHEVGRSVDSWTKTDVFDIKAQLRPGANQLAVGVTNEGTAAGLAARLEIEFESGPPLVVVTDKTWRAAKMLRPAWTELTFDDMEWVAAKEVVKVGGGPWKEPPTVRATANPPAPFLRRTFDVTGRVRRARVYVCGLGYYELHLNGRKVGDHMLDPGYTRYDRRDLYVTYDVTPYLRRGANAMGAILGTGWYDNYMLAAWDFEQAPWRGRSRLLLELRIEYADGRTDLIGSDGTWKASTGPLLYDSIYGGETYDARLEKPGWDNATYNDAAWQPVRSMAPPGGAVTAQEMPAIKVDHALRPVKLTQPKPGVFLFDMGQNFAGIPQLSVQGAAGTKVVMECAEKLHADGTLDASNLDTFVKRRDPQQVFQTDMYILKGVGREVWQPRFTYHGFQYVQVTGFPGTPTLDSLRGVVLHSAFRPTGRFECSNPLLNAIQRNTLWSYISNFQGIPTDCPHREKNGWMGDAQLAAEQGMMNFDSAANYVKWLNDIEDEQKPTGQLPGIVPTGGWGYAWGNGPAWDSAYPLLCWYLYQYFDDVGILGKHYDHLRLYVDYLTSRAQNGIVSIGLGDWVPPGPTAPVAVTDTAYYYRDALIVADAARLLGKLDDARKYTALAAGIKAAFNAKFYDATTGRYADGGQTAQSCALYQGLVEPANHQAVLDRLLAAVDEHQGHIFTGILGAKYVMNSLMENDRNDVAYTIATQRSAPGWGNWIERGATTLWEDWGDGSSRNHIMFGDISAWFYKALAGINGDPAAPGFKHFFIKPNVVGDLTSAHGEYDSIHGLIVSDWKLDHGTFHLNVTVPVNTTATVYVPAAAAALVTESGKPAHQAAGVQFLRDEPGKAVFAIGSGHYSFAAPLAAATPLTPATPQVDPATLPVKERAVADRLGVAHVDGKYHFTDKDFLDEGADQIQQLGSRVIKVWFVANMQGKYPFNSQWPKVNSLVELAQTPYFRSLFAKPFTTFILETYAFGRDDHYWVKSITDADAADETRQFEALTRYLLTAYAGTGKTFVLQNWEGDWAARGHYNRDVVPTPVAIAGMIRWLNARQDGVDRARRDLKTDGVHIYHAAEVNLVAPAMEGKTSVTNDVFPHTHCDLYSYSAYDTSIEGTHFRAALDYIASKAPPSAAFGARNVMVGEFGIPENDFGTATSLASVRRTIQEALDWGCPYLVYWQIYDNECKTGTSDDKGDCRGFWLIKPSGQKSPLWDLLHGVLTGAQ